MSIILRPFRESLKNTAVRKNYLKEYFEDTPFSNYLTDYKRKRELVKQYRDIKKKINGSDVEGGSSYRNLYFDNDDAFNEYSNAVNQLASMNRPTSDAFMDKDENQRLDDLNNLYYTLVHDKQEKIKQINNQIQILLNDLSYKLRWNKVPLEQKFIMNTFSRRSQYLEDIFSCGKYTAYPHSAMSDLRRFFDEYIKYVQAEKRKHNADPNYYSVFISLSANFIDKVIKKYTENIQKCVDKVIDINKEIAEAKENYDDYYIEVKKNRNNREKNHDYNQLVSRISGMKDTAARNYTNLQNEIDRLEAELKLDRKQIRSKSGTGDYYLKLASRDDSLVSDCYKALPVQEKAFFLGWLCKHLQFMRLCVMPESLDDPDRGNSQRVADALGLTGYNTSYKSGDNAWDSLAGSLKFDMPGKRVPERIQKVLDALTASKYLIGITRKSTGSVGKDGYLNATELALYLHFKFGWQFGQALNIDSEHIQQTEVPDNAADFEAGYNS